MPEPAKGARFCAFALVAAGVATPAPKTAAQPRVSVVVTVAPTCGRSLVPAAIDRDAAARLAAAGITVSNVYTARLDIGLDCVAIAPAGRKNTLAVRQCLTYSELVSPLEQNRSILASTWRKCDSYTCNRANCRVSGQYGARLMDEFLAGLRARAELALSPRRTPTTSAPPPRPSIYAAVYAAYIINCLCLLVYWQFRRRPG